MKDRQWLKQRLIDLEGHGYGDYKGIKGDYRFPAFNLSVDYVQGDPFAAPSRICLQVSQEVAKFPVRWITDYAAQTVIADYLTRQVAQVAQSLQQERGSGKSGKIKIAAPSQAVIRRSAVWIDSDGIEVRLTVGLPAWGRRIAGKAAAALLCDDIPQIVTNGLQYSALDAARMERYVQTFQDAEALRNQLTQRELVAFIPEGACLPRQSGVDERPLARGADLFTLPSEIPDEGVELDTPHSGKVKGLGIKAGVTLIVGGGYHGKSTLLKAIEQGVYNHVPGDGRDRTVSHPDTVKLRAEEGRSVSGVDISPLINRLPGARSSKNFSTTNASGSTSQAAGLIEAIEAGAKVLLIDEDTAATNFMIRDRNMQALISKDKEPITPFIDKVRQLYDDYGISTILVMGGSGDYFSVADTVIAMENYQARIVTEQAKAIAQADPNQRQSEGGINFTKQGIPLAVRAVLPDSLPPGRNGRSPKVKAQKDKMTLGYEEIDLRAIEQIVEVHQVRAIAQAILYAQRYYFESNRTLSETLDCVMEDIERGGLDAVDQDERRLGDLAMFRRFELSAAISRLRTLKTISVTKAY
ncbi:MAG: ATPase [Leptolyngbya foveolarum]|uniref:ATPase n=1 Tax=Leptolyngbya foveolarum TaxID=47253 RepID=A0A2W4WFY4_9CYAN|nr:MAG: ATPase [Leptolyngbya foveolarum]